MFDSGFGGLTVARALIDLLPDEDLVYVGDTGRYPYGPRPLDEVRGFAHQITEHLRRRPRREAGGRRLQHRVGRGARRAPATLSPCRSSASSSRACGRSCRPPATATSASSAPSAPSARAPTSGRWPTADAGVKLTCAACPGFVEFVERGETDTDQVHVLAERLLAPARRRRRRHAAARLHPLPVPGPHDQRRDGPRRRAGRSADETAFEVRAPARRARPGPAGRRPTAAATASSPSGDVELVPPSSAASCSAPSSTTSRRRGVGRVTPSPSSAARAATRRPDAPCTGYLVQLRGRPTWPSTSGRARLANLQRHIDLPDLDAVVLSHAHPDHWIDLTGLRTAPEVRASAARACRSSAPPRHRAMAAARAPAPSRRPSTGPSPPTATEFALGAAAVHRSAHRPLRRDPRRPRRRPPTARSLAYSADTGPDWSFDRARRAASTWPCARRPTAPTPRPRASCTSRAGQAGAMARAAGVEQPRAHPLLARARTCRVHARDGRGRLRCARSTIAIPQREVPAL